MKLIMRPRFLAISFAFAIGFIFFSIGVAYACYLFPPALTPAFGFADDVPVLAVY